MLLSLPESRNVYETSLDLVMVHGLWKAQPLGAWRLEIETVINTISRALIHTFTRLDPSKPDKYIVGCLVKIMEKV